MRDKYFYEVMFDDTSIDVSKEVGLVWSIANSLRGAYTSDKYKDVIIPMVIIRRFECALEATKDAVGRKRHCKRQRGPGGHQQRNGAENYDLI